MATFTIRKTNAAESQQARILVYGESGCGKTTSAKTLNPKDTLVVVTENKYEPLLDSPFDFIALKTWDEAVEWLREAGSSGMLRGYRTVYFDGLTALGDQLKTKLVEIEKAGFLEAKMEAAAALGKQTKATGYTDAMELQDWGTYYRRMGNYILGLMALPVPVVICTALADLRDDKSDGTAKRLPMLGGKLAREVVRYFGQVLYMGDKSFQTPDGIVTKRLWRTAIEGNIHAKDSSGKLDPRGEKTDWQNLTGKLFAASATPTNAEEPQQ